MKVLPAPWLGDPVSDPHGDAHAQRLKDAHAEQECDQNGEPDAQQHAHGLTDALQHPLCRVAYTGAHAHSHQEGEIREAP